MSFFGYTRRGIVGYIANNWTHKWERIILHHTFKPTIAQFNERPDGAYWMRVIDRYHRLKGWAGIGYHFVITPDGLIYIGRDLNTSGAHTRGQNSKAIGVCLLGNFDEETPTEPQWSSMKFLLCWLHHRFTIPISELRFHNEFATKTCPGSRLDLHAIRAVIAATMATAVTRYNEILKEGKR